MLWTVRWQGESITLKRKSLDVLLYLIDQRDHVISKENLLEALWPNQFVEESNLTQHIFLLRKALSRHENGTSIIETVPGRGYRFVAIVEEQTLDAHDVILPSSKSFPEITSDERESESIGDTSAGTSPGMHKIISPIGMPASSSSLGASADARLFGLPFSLGLIAGPTAMYRFLIVAAVVSLGAYLAIRSSSPTHWSISAFKRITTDGHPKILGGTDGRRIYFTQRATRSTAEVSISGGPAAPVQLGIEDTWSGDISPDGSTMLINSQARGQGPANSLWSFQLVGGSLRRLAEGAVSSAWSPDGERIVYGLANGDLLVMRRDGSDPLRLASTGGYLRSIAWSPDGGTIRFSKDGLLWEITQSGTNLHQLFPGWSKSPTQYNGEWAPDGRFFFVADGQIWLVEDKRSLLDKGSGNPTQLTFGPTVWDRPIPSLDGKKLFVSGRTRRGELVRFDKKSDQFKTFLAGISAEFVVFSNDSNHVAYVSYPEGILWRANLDGSNPIKLTEPPLYPKVVRWSPDGSQIVFVNSTADAVDAIFVLASDGSGKAQRILPEDRQAETDPSWSPDGQKIIFSTSPNVGASARSDLRIFDRATGKETSLPGSEGLLVPRWSPDGRFISAMSLDAMSLSVCNLSNGRWSKLVTGPVAFPEWSHDGQWIYYVRWTSDRAVLRIRAADGKRESVADLNNERYTGSYTLWMGLDPADNPMMLRDEGTDDIYALSLERR